MSSSLIIRVVIVPTSFAHRPLSSRVEVAISPNTHEVQIFQSTGSGWQLLHTLTEASSSRHQLRFSRFPLSLADTR